MSMKDSFDTERNGRDGRKTCKAVARTLRRRNGKRIIRKIIQKGEDFFSAGNNAAALEAFMEVYKKTPHCAVVCNNIGVVYWTMGDVVNALELRENLFDPTIDRILTVTIHEN